jgi:serine/threonine protein kinase
VPDSARFGPYRLQGEIGRGAMGVVYRAYDERHARVVALKVLSPDISSDTDYRLRFEQESHIVAALTDPHVIPIHSYGEIDQYLYLDMRLVEGRSVKQWLRESGPMSPTQAVSITSQVADALDSAHADGVIHRDVKPSNVLIARHVATRHGRDEFAYLVDFGIARSLGGTGMTSVGFTVGTIDYMAPERFDGQQSGIGADVYALGCLLAECLTGRKPFPGVEVAQVVRGHLHSPPPRPSQLAPGVPAGLDDVIAKAMAKEPARRYHSAGELADAARAALTARTSDPAPSGSRPGSGLGFDPGRATSSSLPVASAGSATHSPGAPIPPPGPPVPPPGPFGSGLRPAPLPTAASAGSSGAYSAGLRQTGPGASAVGPGPGLDASLPPGSSQPGVLPAYLFAGAPPSPLRPNPSPPTRPNQRHAGPGSSGPHGIPGPAGGGDRKVLMIAAACAVLIVIAGVTAVLVHNNRDTGSCAAGANAALTACAGNTSPPASRTSAGPAALSANETAATKVFSSPTSCASTGTSKAPSEQAGHLDAGVGCKLGISGIGALYAFHVKSSDDAKSAIEALANYNGGAGSYGFDSMLDRDTGQVVQATWATQYAGSPEFVLVWPAWQVEVVAVATSTSTSSAELLTALRTVSWQYGNFGGTPDYGSQGTLRNYTKLTGCTAHRLEEISATEYQINVAWLVCPAPKAQPSFTSIELFRVDTATHARADLQAETKAGYTVLKNLKGTDGATGKCVFYRGSLSTVTSIFCQYPTVSGYDQVHLESQLQTTMSPAATRTFFKTHSLNMPTLLDRV